MKKSLLLSVLALVVVTALAEGSCDSAKKPGDSTATQSAATATAAYEEDIDGVIQQLFWDYEHVKDVAIDRKTYYTDSSGTDWIRFDVHVTKAGIPPGTWEYGFMKKAPSENWELVDLGAVNIQCGVPADVQTGLGFAVCPASEEELNKAIEDFLLSGPGQTRKDTDVKIARKAYYTDPSGTDWASFYLLPIPNLADPVYGFMLRISGGSWLGVTYGTGGPECLLPADVQVGLEFKMCYPYEEEMDEAISSFVSSNSAVDRVIVNRKDSYVDPSGTIWVGFGALSVHGVATDQVYGIMKRTPEGNWVGLAGPAASVNDCAVPADVQSYIGIVGIARCTSQPQ